MFRLFICTLIYHVYLFMLRWSSSSGLGAGLDGVPRRGSAR